VPVQYPPDPKDVLLSDMDRQVIFLIAEGQRAKVIADLLKLSRKELTAIYEGLRKKIGTPSWTGVAVWAIRNGVVK
jgi:DNA-binding CsgD family transcriptional regulator